MTSISNLVDGQVPKKRLCVFCYKSVVSESKESEKEEAANKEITIRNFFKFLERYIGLQEKDIQLPGEKSSLQCNTFSKQGNNFWEGLGRCKDCDVVIKTFSDAYHQWKCLELQLEWKVKMLTDIMKSANRVPSRVQQLKDMFQETDVDNVTVSTDGRANKTKLENFKIFRRAITRKCDEKISKTLPRVILKRLGVISDLQGAPSCPGLKHEVGQNDNDLSACANNVGVAAFLGWSMSMAAVALLASATGGVSRVGSGELTIDKTDGMEAFERMNASLHHTSSASSSFVTVENQGSVEVPSVNTDEKQEIVQHDEDFTNHVEDHGILDNINNEYEAAPSLPDSFLHQNDIGESIVLERNESGGVNIEPIVQSPIIRENSGNTLGEHENLEMLPSPGQKTEVKESNYNCQGPPISAGLDVALNENMSQMETVHEEEFEQDSYTSSSSSDDEEELKIEIKEEFTSSNNQRQSFHKNLFPCTVCSQMLKNRHGLRIHMIEQHSTHSGNHKLRCYHCKICKTAFKRNSDLRRHKMTKRHQTRRKLFLTSQKRLKMKRLIKVTDSSVKLICVNLSKGEATSANAEIIELQQTSLSVNPQVWKEPAIEGAMQVEKEDCRKLKEIVTETVPATKKQTVQKEADKTSPVPQKRYSLRGNRKKSYHEMAIEDEDDPNETNNDTDFQLDDHHENSLEDQESSSSSESDQDTSGVHISEMPDVDTYSDEDDAMHKLKNAVKVEKDVEAKRSNTSVPVTLPFYTNDNRQTTCNYCKKVFEKYASCREHKTNCHNNSNKFICKVKQCLYRFKILEDLKTHQKLHGEFKCNFCDLVKCFAPDLSLHEMEHAFKPEPIAERTEKPTAALKKFNCPRCPFSCHLEARYVKHHLKSHLNLIETVCTCSICGKGAMTDKFLVTHFKTHHKTDGLDASQIWKCDSDKCSAYFLTNDQLSQHKIRIHNKAKGINTCPNRQFPCNYCKKVFEKYISCKEHKANFHKAANKFICKVKQCLYRFKTLEDLKTHQKLHGEFKCKFCDVVKCFAPDVSLHEMEHAFRPEPTTEQSERSTAALKKFICPRCPFNSYLESTYVKHHLKSHLNLDGTVFTCSICGKEAKTDKFLATHFRVYHKTDGLDASQIWKCDKCPAYFLTNDQLSQHKIRIHNKGSTTCPECSRTYKSRHSLRYHMEKMHPNSSFNPGHRCHFADCERKFSTQRRLDKHISKAHENSSSIRMIKCTKCSKEFKGEQRLKNHMNVVHVIPSFVCSICGKAFKTKHGLAYHMDYHNPETWGFQCSTCGKKLATNQKLEEHTRTHTKEKPFICQFCGEKYAHRHNWRNHLKSKHPDEFAELEHNKDAKKSGNFLSRKGSKKGDVITAGTKA